MSPKKASKKKVDPVIHDLACALTTVLFRERYKTYTSITKGSAESFYKEYLKAVDHFSELDFEEIRAQHEQDKSRPPRRGKIVIA